MRIRSGTLVVTVAAVSGVALLLGSCSSSEEAATATNTSDASLDGAFGADGASNEASQEEASADEGSPDDAISEAAEEEASTDGATSDGRSNATCQQEATHKACIACCDRTHAVGAGEFGTFLKLCACSDNICGPGGADDAGAPGDAQADGAAPARCSAAECNGAEKPMAACAACALRSFGSLAQQGPCYASVVSACTGSAPCKAWAACSLLCP